MTVTQLKYTYMYPGSQTGETRTLCAVTKLQYHWYSFDMVGQFTQLEQFITDYLLRMKKWTKSSLNKPWNSFYHRPCLSQGSVIFLPAPERFTSRNPSVLDIDDNELTAGELQEGLYKRPALTCSRQTDAAGYNRPIKGHNWAQQPSFWCLWENVFNKGKNAAQGKSLHQYTYNKRINMKKRRTTTGWGR